MKTITIHREKPGACWVVQYSWKGLPYLVAHRSFWGALWHTIRYWADERTLVG